MVCPQDNFYAQRGRAPVQFAKEKYAGPFSTEQYARVAADRENARSTTVNESYIVGTKDEIGAHGIIV